MDRRNSGMPKKLPAMMFYTGDWLKDPHLSMCTPATRGIWVDIISRMHENGRSGLIKGTVEQLSRIARCSEKELMSAARELKSTDAASVTIRNKNITLTNRRMAREHVKREANKKRQSTHRQKDMFDGDGECNADITPYTSYSTSYSNNSYSSIPFPQWSDDQFMGSIKEANRGILESEIEKEFYEYWTEPDRDGHRKFQSQKTWHTGRRMNTWKRNHDQWASKKQQPASGNNPHMDKMLEEIK